MCFEPEGSPSGRRLYVQVWWSVFYMHQISSIVYTLFSAYNTAYLMHVKHTIFTLYLQPSS
jgi:hypothetical protein